MSCSGAPLGGGICGEMFSAKFAGEILSLLALTCRFLTRDKGT